MKNLNITSKEEFFKFIHKKNTNKGKIQSIKITKNINTEYSEWVIYYDEPLNKNHINSKWKLNINNNVHDVYNASIVIRSSDKNEDIPNILDLIDIDNYNTYLSNFRINNINKKFKNNDDEQDDDDDIDDDFDEEVINYGIYNEDEETEEIEDNDMNETIINSKKYDKAIDFKEDLNINLEILTYEKYDYDAPYIPI